MAGLKLRSVINDITLFQWNTLVLEDTARICQWYAQNVDSEQILEGGSIVWVVLDFLKQVCGFFYIDGLVTDEVVVAKRSIYIQVIVTCVTRCSSLKGRATDFQWLIEKMLGDIEQTLTFNLTNPMHELVTHCSYCLSILNSITAGPVCIAVKSTLDSYLLSTRSSSMVLAFMSAASRCLASLQDMVSLLENAITCHFVRLHDGELRNSWAPIMQAFVVPELSKEDFVSEALKQNALLTLYSYNLSRIGRVASQAEHLDIMIDCVTWCSKPQLDKDSEAKVLLLWLQIFDIIRTVSAQSHVSDEQWKSIAKYMMFLSASTQTLGEDKHYSGVLGVVGIGRRSGLTKE